MSKELIDSFAQAVRAIYKDDPSKEQAGIDAARSALETAIEALQARVADQSAQLTRHTNLIDQLQEERCKLAAELAAARAQEPVSHRYRFTHPISGEPVWRDSSPTWNGQCVQEVQPLFAAPVPPVLEPDWLLETTKELAKAIHRDNYPDVPQWEVLDDLPGVISQIDNMVCGMERKTPVREPLTDAEIEAIARAHGTGGWQTLADMQTFARAIEAAIKEQK